MLTAESFTGLLRAIRERRVLTGAKPTQPQRTRFRCGQGSALAVVLPRVLIEQWRLEGVPEFPRAWIIQTAKHKAIDRLRRQTRFEEKLASFAPLVETVAEPNYDTEEIPDDRLRLIFTCCHPALALDAQVALTLRTLGGLQTDEIARAFLVPPTTMAQRLVRAKPGLTHQHRRQ